MHRNKIKWHSIACAYESNSSHPKLNFIHYLQTWGAQKLIMFSTYHWEQKTIFRAKQQSGTEHITILRRPKKQNDSWCQLSDQYLVDFPHRSIFMQQNNLYINWRTRSVHDIILTTIVQSTCNLHTAKATDEHTGDIFIKLFTTLVLTIEFNYF